MTETRFPTGISGKKNDDLDISSDSDIALYPQGHIWISQGTKLIFEGTTPDDWEVKLQATSITADRDIILPDANGTVAVSVSDTTTTTQGELNLDFTLSAAGNISATGTAFGISSASSPIFAGLTINGSSIVFEGSSEDANETTLTVTNPTADNTITLPNASGTVAVSVSDTTTTTQGQLNLDFTLSSTGNISATGSAFGLTSSGTPTFASITFPDGTNQTTAFNFTGYDNEVHVSAVNGNDTTGNGDLLKPVASITKALTIVSTEGAGGRRTVVIHPGTYNESPTTSVTNTTISTTELTGANTQLNGTLTLGAAARVSGLKMNNLTLNTSGNVYISNCTVDTQLIKSGLGYTEIINSELQCSSGCQFTGAGQVFINGNKIFSPSVSNASASVTIRGANQIVNPSVTAGVLTIENSVVVSSSPSSNAITSSASSIVTLANSFVLDSTGTTVERIALSGFYSILNVVYDKANSTLAASSGTGGSTNSVDYFQYINADRVIANLAPVDSKGVAGDRAGMIAADGSYLYICTADYTTGVADIWSRTSISASTW
jgi:hypothetical protein